MEWPIKCDKTDKRDAIIFHHSQLFSSFFFFSRLCDFKDFNESTVTGPHKTCVLAVVREFNSGEYSVFSIAETVIFLASVIIVSIRIHNINQATYYEHMEPLRLKVANRSTGIDSSMPTNDDLESNSDQEVNVCPISDFNTC